MVSHSWKGDLAKSGGVATNIGIHFFDMLSFLFGPRRQTFAHLSEPSKCSGFIEYQNADVQWYLSVDASDLSPVGNPQLKTFREIKIDGREIEFSDGFSDLHLESYQQIYVCRIMQSFTLAMSIRVNSLKKIDAPISGIKPHFPSIILNLQSGVAYRISAPNAI